MIISCQIRSDVILPFLSNRFVLQVLQCGQLFALSVIIFLEGGGYRKDYIFLFLITLFFQFGCLFHKEKRSKEGRNNKSEG